MESFFDFIVFDHVAYPNLPAHILQSYGLVSSPRTLLEIDELFDPVESEVMVRMTVLDHGTKFLNRLKAYVNDKKPIELEFQDKVPLEDLGDILSGLF